MIATILSLFLVEWKEPWSQDPWLPMLAVFLGLYPLICLSHTFCTCKISTLPPLLTLVQIRWIDGREICLEHLREPHEYKVCQTHASAGAPPQPSHICKPLIPRRGGSSSGLVSRGRHLGVSSSSQRPVGGHQARGLPHVFLFQSSQQP